MIHRYETDSKCPRPTHAEARQSLGRRALTVVTLLLVMLLAAMASAVLSTLATAATSNVYWRVDLNQGSSIIAHGQGSTEQAAWEDCFRLQVITRAMTAAETRKLAVSAVNSPVVRWCQNPKRYATISKDVVTSSATLNWQHVTPPAIVGFRIVHGADPNALVETIQVPNPLLRSYTLTNLTPGPRYFAVKAYDSTGNESPLSEVISKVIL